MAVAAQAVAAGEALQLLLFCPERRSYLATTE